MEYIKKLTEIFEENNFALLLDECEKISVREITLWGNTLFSDGIYDYHSDFYDKLSDSQKSRWEWIVSTDRERKRILSKDNITDEDLEDLRATDF